MSWLDNYKRKNERERVWTVSADGRTVYRGDGCKFKRIVLPSVVDTSAQSAPEELELLEDEHGFGEIAS